MAETARQLDYAPAPSSARRRVRTAFRILVNVAMVVAGIVWGPAIWRAASLHFWQRQCMTYVAPAGTLACEEPPQWGGVTPPFTVRTEEPKPLSNYLALLEPAPSSWGQGPVLFLHARITAGGTKRLVIVRRIPPGMRFGWDAPLALEVLLVEPASFGGKPTTESTLHHGPLQSFVGQGENDPRRLRLFAGRPDPNDASRFMIDFELDGERGEIVGVLRDEEGVDSEGQPKGPTVDFTGPP